MRAPPARAAAGRGRAATARGGAARTRATLMATGAMAHAHEGGYGHETNPAWARDEAEKRSAARRARDGTPRWARTL